MELSTTKRNVDRRELRAQKNKLSKGIIKFLEHENYQNIIVRKDPKGIEERIFFQLNEKNKTFWLYVEFYVENNQLDLKLDGFVIDLDSCEAAGEFESSVWYSTNPKLILLTDFVLYAIEKIREKEETTTQYETPPSKGFGRKIISKQRFFILDSE